MENSDYNKKRQQIQSSLAWIVESSDKWLVRLRRQERRVRLAGSLLTASLCSLAVGTGALVYQIVQGHLYVYFQQPNFGMAPPPAQVAIAFAIAGGLALIGALAAGPVTYLLLKLKHTRRLQGISAMVTEMKDKLAQQTTGTVTATEKDQGLTENTLAMADRIMTVLPQLIKNRKHDPVLFGAAASVIAAIVTKNPVAAIIAGVLVWLYLRHRITKSYEQEILELERQRLALVQQL
jgi:hypothetical protein